MEGRFDTHNNEGRYYTKFRSSLNREVHHTSDVSDVGLDNYHDVRKTHKQASMLMMSRGPQPTCSSRGK